MKSKIIIFALAIIIIAQTTNAQPGWFIQSAFTPKNLYSVAATAIHNLYMGSDSGIVFKSSDNGYNWSVFTQDTSVKSLPIRFVFGGNNDDFNAAGDSTAYIRKSGLQVTSMKIIPGASQNKPNLKTYSYIQGCCAYEADMVAGEGGFFFIRDLYPWREDTAATLLAGGRRINSSSGYIFVGDAGLIMKADSIGIIRPDGTRIKWKIVPGGTTQNLYSVDLISSGLCMAVGAGGIILKSTDFGETWTSLPSPTTEDLHSVTIGYSSYLACGNNGTIIRCLITGNWFRQTTPTVQNLHTIITLSYTDFLSMGDNGIILRTTDGGGPPAGIIQTNNQIPTVFGLEQNYPNPFNPNSVIRFNVPKQSDVKLVVYDARGRKVETLVDESLRPGNYEADFNGINLSSGVYFYKLIAGNTIISRKMVLIK